MIFFFNNEILHKIYAIELQWRNLFLFFWKKTVAKWKQSKMFNSQIIGAGFAAHAYMVSLKKMIITCTCTTKSKSIISKKDILKLVDLR